MENGYLKLLDIYVTPSSMVSSVEVGVFVIT